MNDPVKGEIIKDFGRGVVLRQPVQGNYEWVVAHLREGDQKEHDDAVVDADVSQWPAGLLQATLWLNDELAAYWDSIILSDKTAQYPMRAWAFSTTPVVEKHKIKFARMSKVVYDYLWTLEHPWVKHALVMPWDGYTRCLKWQKKYFDAEPIERFTLNGEAYTAYTLARPKGEN